jgi:hypothetical protein
MYKAAIVLSVIPSLLLLVAWLKACRSGPDSSIPKWRVYCLFACLIAATVSIPAGLAESLAWLNAGGDPHGMGTAPGIWLPLRRLFLWTLFLVVVLGLLARGRGRIAGVSAAIAAFLANLTVALIDFD